MHDLTNRLRTVSINCHELSSSEVLNLSLHDQPQVPCCFAVRGPLTLCRRVAARCPSVQIGR